MPLSIYDWLRSIIMKRNMIKNTKDYKGNKNEETLIIHLRCYNSANREEQEINLPYRFGAEVKLTPHPYLIKVIRLDDEEVELEVDDGKKITKHIVQLNNRAERNDEWPYATGNPNDPVDTKGPILYMSLVRK